MLKMKRVVPTLLLVFLMLPLWAQEKTDTTYLFRFVAEQDMFYVPYTGNDKELARLEACVRQHRADILAGSIPLYVDGYAKSMPTDKDNLVLAKTRSNRVKSELIIHSGLTEDCFVTHNHAEQGDLVTVRISVPTYNKVEQAEVQPAVEATQEPAKEEKQESVEETAVTTDLPSEQAGTEQPAVKDAEASLPVLKGKAADSYHFALRANLLRWATLTPDLSIEWRINRHVGIAVGGTWTSWSWDDKNRRYALWEVAPEVRWYLGKQKRGYIGAMYKAGEFNYKLSATGKQGDLTGGGLTGGYQLRLNDALDMDFTLGIGCLHADYEKYEVVDGVRVRRGTESKNWWGPVNAGVTLVWKLGR